nr:unnamed protein product [uncultured bacterium]
MKIRNILFIAAAAALSMSAVAHQPAKKSKKKAKTTIVKEPEVKPVDAIDSLAEKADLIRHATRTGACFVSSMGTARKMDPTRLQRAEFWKVRGCPLARALRERFKREGDRPRRKFLCVYSDEVLPNLGAAPEPAEAHETNAATPSADAPAWHARKVHTNGSLAHITGMAGLMLAGTVMQELTKEKPSPGYNSQYS